MIPNENLFLDSRIIVVEGTAFKVPFKLVVLVALNEDNAPRLYWTNNTGFCYHRI